MGTTRRQVTFIVNDVIARGFVYEGAKGEMRGAANRQFLYIDSRKRWVLAIDIRATRTSLMVCNLLQAKPLTGVTSVPTETNVKPPRQDGWRIGSSARSPSITIWAVPGHRRRRTPAWWGPAARGVLFSRRVWAWRDVPLREALAAATRLPVTVENSGRACARSRELWASRPDAPAAGDIAFVNVSDGIGVGIVVRGEVLRGLHNVAGEFGHIPLNVDGPPCACGADRMLGSVRLQPRHALAVFRARGRPAQADAGRKWRASRLTT